MEKTIPTRTKSDSKGLLSQNDDDLSWDDLCMNPYQKSLAEGMEEGHEAGLKSGFKEGEALGRSKALEIGVEIGFYEGCANYLVDHFLPNLREKSRLSEGKNSLEWGADNESNKTNSWTEEKVENLIRGWKELLEIIHTFPSPDDIFYHGNKFSVTKEIQEMNDQEQFFLHSDVDNLGNEMKIADADIVGNLQRIRSKFKVLTIKLKISKFSLRGLMDNVKVQNDQMNENILNQRTLLETRNGNKTEAEIVEHEW